jgi:hypothetical protein
MRPYRSFLLVFALLFTLAAGLPLFAQDDSRPPKNPGPTSISRITVEVTGGDANKPIENASVYLKTVEERRIKDKKTEISVKTNQEGIAHLPDVALGRVLIQVVADGWKTYGHWYDITDPRQTITIHLDRPPKWY